MSRHNPDLAREFTTDDGRKFNVHYVPAGAPTYQLGGGTDYRASEPVAEFYDARYIGTPAADGHPLGQFTGASYYVSTLIASAVDGRYGGERTGPFRLHGGVPAWNIDGGTWLDIVAWIVEHGTPTADRAVLLEGWPVRRGGKRAARHGEVYGDASRFRAYTSHTGEASGGWYVKVGTADCGHTYDNTGTDGIASMSTGYGVDRKTDESRCNRCWQRDSLAQLDNLAPGKDHTMIAYVSADGERLTTWPGHELAEVVGHRVSRSGWHGSRVHHWVFRRGTATFYGTNGGAGTPVRVHRHARRPSYIPAGTSPVFVAVDANGVAL